MPGHKKRLDYASLFWIHVFSNFLQPFNKKAQPMIFTNDESHILFIPNNKISDISR